MGERRVGFWLGLVAVIAGLVLMLAFNHRDGFVLGGCGLIVLGALSIAIGFEDSPPD